MQCHFHRHRRLPNIVSHKSGAEEVTFNRPLFAALRFQCRTAIYLEINVANSWAKSSSPFSICDCVPIRSKPGNLLGLDVCCIMPMLLQKCSACCEKTIHDTKKYCPVPLFIKIIVVLHENMDRVAVKQIQLTRFTVSCSWLKRSDMFVSSSQIESTVNDLLPLICRKKQSNTSNLQLADAEIGYQKSALAVKLC